MDILNDYYPLVSDTIEHETSISDEDYEYINQLDNINSRSRRKKILSSDDFNMKYGDDIWYIWNIIRDYSDGQFLDRMDYASFCSICYDHSTKY
jgi:hypothetical protein